MGFSLLLGDQCGRVVGNLPLIILNGYTGLLLKLLFQILQYHGSYFSGQVLGLASKADKATRNIHIFIVEGENKICDSKISNKPGKKNGFH